LAQGVNSTAAKKHARLIRKTPEGRQEIPFDLGKVLAAKANDMPLQDEDIVFVPGNAVKGGIKSMPGIVASAVAAAVYHF